MVIDTESLQGDDYVHLGDLQRLLREYGRQMDRVTEGHPHHRTVDIVDMFFLLSELLPEMIQSVWAKPEKGDQ
jgi:hypothetical protein